MRAMYPFAYLPSLQYACLSDKQITDVQIKTNREEKMLSRRSFVAAAGLAPLIITGKAKAASFEGQTLRVNSWGGSDGLAIQKYIVDPFMKATGAKVIVEEGVTSASIAKVVAQKDDPQLDVVFLDDVGVFALHRQGLLDELDLSKIPNAKDVYPDFVLDGGFGIGF